jgi:protein-S-isoprenylcysteine O-methyltransferase Ste14
MSRTLTAAYGLVAYAFFLVTFVYAIAFVGNLPLGRTIDAGPVGDPLWSIVVDLVLLTIFAVQHSVMARPAFKRWWTRFVPPAAERSTYVLFATAALALLIGAWRPLPDVIWSVAPGAATIAIQAVFWLGWIVLLTSTFLISHFELFGLRQSFARPGAKDGAPTFRTPFLYRLVRHPLYVGFLLAFWAAPTMTAGHLLFTIATTGYILIGITLEERDLVDTFGDRYRRYRTEVGMLWPRAARGAGDASRH